MTVHNLPDLKLKTGNQLNQCTVNVYKKGKLFWLMQTFVVHVHKPTKKRTKLLHQIAVLVNATLKLTAQQVYLTGVERFNTSSTNFTGEGGWLS